jgi:homoserine dehydrogenase
MKPIQVGLLGIGTVGGGTFSVLHRNQEEISRRAGRGILIKVVADKDLARARAMVGDRAETTDDAFALVRRPDIDIVVELIGGTKDREGSDPDGNRKRKACRDRQQGIAGAPWKRDILAAQKKGVMVAFEAAVAGGVPIIKALREGLTANRIEWIAGIINGTSNFILSEMREKGSSFADVLARAQKLGYAETDPTFDIEGVDAAHKLTIMAAIAFGIPMQFDKVYTEGISRLTKEDIRYAEELGYRIKLLGITRRTAKGIELRVHPTLIPVQAADRQRGRCDERDFGQRRCGWAYALLWGRCRSRTYGVSRRRGSGGRHQNAYGRSRATRAPSRVPAGPDVGPADSCHGGRGNRLLPATACSRPSGSAGGHYAHSQPINRFQ